MRNVGGKRLTPRERFPRRWRCAFQEQLALATAPTATSCAGDGQQKDRAQHGHQETGQIKAEIHVLPGDELHDQTADKGADHAHQHVHQTALTSVGAKKDTGYPACQRSKDNPGNDSHHTLLMGYICRFYTHYAAQNRTLHRARRTTRGPFARQGPPRYNAGVVTRERKQA